MKPERKRFLQSMEEIKNSCIGDMESEYGVIIPMPMSRYEKLVACEMELNLLRNALSRISGCDLNGLRRLFDIEKKGE